MNRKATAVYFFFRNAMNMINDYQTLGDIIDYILEIWNTIDYILEIWTLWYIMDYRLGFRRLRNIMEHLETSWSA